MGNVQQRSCWMAGVAAMLCLHVAPCGAQDAGASFDVIDDAKAYVTSPLRWDNDDWLLFAGALAAIGAAHHYDDNMRAHFVNANPALATTTQKHELSDAAPAAAVFGLAWIAAATNNSSGYREGWAMTEAAAFSGATAFVLKYAAGRQRPYQTNDPNQWRRSGDAFPSMHTTLAFAIGTTFAESGSEDLRWLRRAIGYGVGAGTAYLRIKHNQHWLSDTVAGAALGASSAFFVLDRQDERIRAAGRSGTINVAPRGDGLELRYSLALR